MEAQRTRVAREAPCRSCICLMHYGRSLPGHVVSPPSPLAPAATSNPSPPISEPLLASPDVTLVRPRLVSAFFKGNGRQAPGSASAHSGVGSQLPWSEGAARDRPSSLSAPPQPADSSLTRWSLSATPALTVFSPDGHVSTRLTLSCSHLDTADGRLSILLCSTRPSSCSRSVPATLSACGPAPALYSADTLGPSCQVDYALEAVAKGTAAVGVKSSSCVVLGVEKKTALQLQDPRTVRKVAMIDDHVCLAFAGTCALRRLAERAA